MPPVQNNQPGTGFVSRGRSVGLVLSVTPLGKLPAPRIAARGAIWAHIQIKNHIRIWRKDNKGIVQTLFVVILWDSVVGGYITEPVETEREFVEQLLINVVQQILYSTSRVDNTSGSSANAKASEHTD